MIQTENEEIIQKENVNKKYLWYVSYGSNMLKDRFMCYINGGQFREGGAVHQTCSDTSEPKAVKNFHIPHNMYFRNASRSWENKGVSFIDITKPGHAYGVAYLITDEQFTHVAFQENGGNDPKTRPNGYNTICKVGEIEGIDVVTITNDKYENFNEPSQAYLDVLKKGLMNNYSELLSEEEIDSYLKSCIVSEETL